MPNGALIRATDIPEMIARLSQRRKMQQEIFRLFSWTDHWQAKGIATHLLKSPLYMSLSLIGGVDRAC